MAAYKQTGFDDIEALPLFSGTPVSVQGQEPAEPISCYRQTGFFSCSICRDTGKVGKRYCWCQAGQVAKKADDALTDIAERAAVRAQTIKAMRSSSAAALEL